MSITIEKLDHVLSLTPLKIKTPIEEPGEFVRDRFFEVFGVKYYINWWKNVCYLIMTNDVKVLFYNIEYTSTWPNNYKKSLHFKDENNENICILPVEKYDKQINQQQPPGLLKNNKFD